MAIIKKPKKYDINFEQPSASAYFLGKWRGRDTLLEIPHPREGKNAPTKQPVERKPIKEQFRALIEPLCTEHPSICTDPEILGGTPHIKGTRLSVRTVLGKLYLHGSVQAVLDIYEPHLSEEQVKDAIAYAQDFLEMACDPNEP
jgi:uncharacterized protein (DUF433 family)